MKLSLSLTQILFSTKMLKNYKNYLDKQQPKDQRIIDGIYHFEHLENKLIIFLC